MKTWTCSGRYARLFARAIARYPSLQSEAAQLLNHPLDERIELEHAYVAITRWMGVAGDDGFGLIAALESHLGCGGPLDYAIHTASTLRDSIQIAQKFAWMYADGFELSLSCRDSSAFLELRSALVPTPRAVQDFMLGAWYRNHLVVQLEHSTDVHCWFTCPSPRQASLHRAVFPGATLHFGAKFDGFSFDAKLLTRALPNAFPVLHALHCQHLECFGASSHVQSTTAVRVRRSLATRLSGNRVSATQVARSLHMSRRTLVRRLRAEGTTFTQEVDKLRQELALRLLPIPSVPLREITTLLGFSQIQAFHRAFKRWTGRTPQSYRNAGTH